MAPKTLLLYGTVGCGKSTLLRKIPSYFPTLPVLRLPAHIQANQFVPQMDWAASYREKRLIYKESLESQWNHSLVLVDDIHRMDRGALSILLRHFEDSNATGLFIATCLNPLELGENIADRFTWSYQVHHAMLNPIQNSFIHNWTLPALGEWPEYIVKECQKNGFHSHRAEVAWVKGALLFAAEQGDAITLAHLEQTRLLALGHRTSFPVRSDKTQLPQTGETHSSQGSGTHSPCRSRTMPPLKPYEGRILLDPLVECLRPHSGIGKKMGRHKSYQKEASPSPSIGYRSAQNWNDLHWPATLRHAVVRSFIHGSNNKNGIRIHQQDCQQHIRKMKQGVSHILVLDGSGSMHAPQRMALGRALFSKLVSMAYPRKEKVAVMVFRNEKLELVVPLGSRWALADKLLNEMECKGRSPLHHLFSECALYAQKIDKMPRVGMPHWIILSDFRPNGGGESYPGSSSRKSMLQACADFAKVPHPKIILNAEEGTVRMGLAQTVASILHAPCLSLNQFMDQSVR